MEKPIDFDTYWRTLVHRVYHTEEELTGTEAFFYRLSCIYGETMVGGLESYFDERGEEFDADMQALRQAGFPDLAHQFEAAKTALIGSQAPRQQTFRQAIQGLNAELPELVNVQKTIDELYDRVIPRLESLDDFKYDLGLRQGFYHED